MMNKVVRDSHKFGRNATVPMTEKKLVKMVSRAQKKYNIDPHKHMLCPNSSKAAFAEIFVDVWTPCCSQLHYLVIPTDIIELIIGTPS